MVDLLIPGPEGKIEAKYIHNNNDQSPIALILHPDPSRGGTMNTKIVFKLFKLFVNNGFSAIRFNFRGVGKSEGIYDDGEGELTFNKGDCVMAPAAIKHNEISCSDDFEALEILSPAKHDTVKV